MAAIILLFKTVLVVWSLLIVGNYFRSLYLTFAYLKNKSEIDTVSISRAKMLLLLGVAADWITAVAIRYGECMIYGKSSEYSANFLFVVGVLLLIIALVSAVLAVAVAWSKNTQNRSFATSFKSLVGTNFAFAIVLWSSTWVIL